MESRFVMVKNILFLIMFLFITMIVPVWADTGFNLPYPTISSDFGPRNVSSGSYFHLGTDFGATKMPLLAIETGNISSISYQETGAGLYINIKSSTADRTSEYFHNFERKISATGHMEPVLNIRYPVSLTGTNSWIKYVELTDTVISSRRYFIVLLRDAGSTVIKALSSVSGIRVSGTNIRTTDVVNDGDLFGITGNTGGIRMPYHCHLGFWITSKSPGSRYNPMFEVQRPSVAPYGVTIDVKPKSGTVISSNARFSAQITSSHRFDLDGVDFFVDGKQVWQARYGGLRGGLCTPSNIRTKQSSTATGVHAIGGVGTDSFVYNMDSLAGLAAGVHTFTVVAVSCRGEVYPPVSMNFNVQATSGITGTVKSTTGAAISGATVNIMPGNWTITTDGDGKYQKLGIAAGTYKLTANAVGFSCQIKTETVAVSPVTISNFVLRPASTISGTVKTPSGQPIGGVLITSSLGEAMTTGAGDYKIITVPHGVYTLTASKVGFTGGTPVTVTVTAAPASANFILTPMPASIGGTVKDNADKRISGASVTISTGATSSGGSYNFTGLAAFPLITYTINASATGYVTQTKNITLAPGQSVTNNFVLSKPVPGTIRVTVKKYSADGLGTIVCAQGVPVTISGPVFEGHNTNFQGIAAFPNIPVGTYMVSSGTWSKIISVASGVTVDVSLGP